MWYHKIRWTWWMLAGILLLITACTDSSTSTPSPTTATVPSPTVAPSTGTPAPPTSRPTPTATPTPTPQVGVPLQMELGPAPAIVPLNAKVDFDAVIRDLAGNPYRDQRVHWYVNGTEGGAPEVGGITKAGVYTAPGKLPGSASKVTVRAQAVASAAVVEEITFLLEELTVTPKTVEGEQPGQRFPLRVEARLSDGATEDITALDTTKIVAPHPTVGGVAPNAPGTLVLGNGAGRSLVSVEDHRADPVAATRVAVTNRTTYQLELRPGKTVRSIRPGERSSLQVGVVPDRGSQAGSFLDISKSASLSVRAGNRLGAVSSGEAGGPANREDLVAWWDSTAGELVFGGRPGTTSFTFTEEKSGQTVALTAHLVDLEMDVASYWEWPGPGLQGPNDLVPMPAPPAGQPIEGDPTLIFTPGPATEPNQTMHLNVLVSDASGQLATDELADLLQEEGLVAESLTGKGQIRDAGKLFIFSDGGPPVSLGKPASPSLDARAEVPISLVEGFTDLAAGAPADALGGGVLYSPGGPGDQPLKVSIPGTTADAVTVPVKGRFPRLSVKMQDLKSGALHDSVFPGPKVLFVTGVYDTGFQNNAEPARGFDLELTGTSPQGPIAPDQNLTLGSGGPGVGGSGILGPNLSNDRFLLAMTEPGTWKLAVKAKQYDQVLADPVEIQVRNRAVTVDMPDTVQGLYPANGPTHLTLQLRKPMQVPDEQGQLWSNASLELVVGGYIPTEKAPFYPSANWVSGTSVQFGDSLYYDGTPAEVPILCDPQDESRGKAVVSMQGLDSLTSDLDLGVTASIMTPLHPDCHLFYYFKYEDSITRASSVNEGEDQPVLFGLGYYPIIPPRLQVSPSTLLLTRSDEGTPVVTRQVSIGGQGVLDAFTGGASLAAGSLRIEDDSGQQPSWLTVKSVQPLNEFSLGVTLEIDTSHPDFALGNYSGHLALGNMSTTFDLSIARLLLSGPEEGDDDPTLPIPLNATWKGQKEQGVMPFEARLTGAQTRAVVHLATGPDAQGIGFGRTCTARTYDSPARECTITGKDAYLFFDTSQLAADTGQTRDKVSVPLFGDVTDRTGSRMVAGPSTERTEAPDGLPDKVSSGEGAEAIVLKADAGDTGDPVLFKTTRFNFVTELVGTSAGGATGPGTVERDIDSQGQTALRTGKLNLGVGHDAGAPPDQFAASPNFTTYYETLQSLSWWEDFPSEKANQGPQEPERDMFPHVDNMHQFAGDSGLLDMFWLMLRGKDSEGNPQDRRVGNDGRVRDFFRENHPGGAPDATIISGDEERWRPFGVQLDGTCFDAGVAFDYPPNHPDLLSAPGYKTPRGLLRGEGDMSGGLVHPQTGEFVVVSRTPGVDFPGLNCGYQVDGRPEDLGDNDIEDVLANEFKYEGIGEGDKLTPYLDSPHPFRVTTFGEAGMFQEEKEIRTAMHIGGRNAAFRIVTDPLGDDGKPLMKARIRAILDLAPSLPYSPGGEITLTARPDSMARAYAAGKRIAVSTSIALATGALGAAFAGGPIIVGALINGGVAFTFQAADESGGGLNHHLGAESAAVSTATSTGVGKIAARRGAQTATRDLTRETTEDLMTAQSFKFTGREIGSAGLDVLGGIVAGMINDEIDDTDYYDDVDMGHAEAYIAEQLGLIVPQNAPVDDNSCGSDPQPSSGVRTMWATNFETYRLDANNPSPVATKVETGTYAEDYYKLTQPAPGRQRLLVIPGSSLDPKQVDTSKHPRLAGGPASTANFALCVGGESATSLPFFQTVSVSVQRNTEEATARVRIDRRGPMTLNLIGIEVLEAR